MPTSSGPIVLHGDPTAALHATPKQYVDTKQPLDADLTTIAGLTATTDGILQSKVSAWSVRTPAQVKADMTPSTSLNTAFGHLVQGVVTGGGNSGFGHRAQQALTGGIDNTGLGFYTQNKLTSGSRNTAVGLGAQENLTIGNNNTAIGVGAQQLLVGGNDNTAVGFQSQLKLSGGSSNTALGFQSQFNLTTGGGNTAVGHLAHQNMTTGSGNTAVGLQSQQTMTAGSNNSAFGFLAQNVLTSGLNNAAVGYMAQQALTSGNNNVALGTEAQKSFTTGTNSTALGAFAGSTDGVTSTTPTLANVTLLGYRAQALVDNVCVIGSRVAADRQSLCLGNYGEVGTGRGVFALSNASVVPTTNPTGGGVLFAEGGALKWRGSSGTVSTIAAA